MKLLLNLAPKPLERHRAFKVFYSSAALTSILLFLFLGTHVYHIRKSASQFRLSHHQAAAQIAQFSARRRELVDFFSHPDNASLHDRAAFVNSIIDARSFNWTRMFMDLERVIPPGVHVMNIEPKQLAGQAAVKMTIAAENEDAKLKFLNALEESDAFSHLQLTNVHTEVRQAESSQFILELTFVYARS
jgi:Tfp pilus assembly protein PilN